VKHTGRTKRRLRWKFKSVFTIYFGSFNRSYTVTRSEFYSGGEGLRLIYHFSFWKQGHSILAQFGRDLVWLSPLKSSKIWKSFSFQPEIVTLRTIFFLFLALPQIVDSTVALLKLYLFLGRFVEKRLERRNCSF